jgi:hypothetical protein
LETAGLEALVQGEQAFQITGQVPTRLVAPTVWVIRDGGAEKAKDLVSSFREGSGRNPVEGTPWRCSCGEENEGRFTECWRCGKAGPDL